MNPINKKKSFNALLNDFVIGEERASFNDLDEYEQGLLTAAFMREEPLDSLYEFLVEGKNADAVPSFVLECLETSNPILRKEQASRLAEMLLALPVEYYRRRIEEAFGHAVWSYQYERETERLREAC